MAAAAEDQRQQADEADAQRAAVEQEARSLWRRGFRFPAYGSGQSALTEQELVDALQGNGHSAEIVRVAIHDWRRGRGELTSPWSPASMPQ